ncbi:MAG TPA: glycosyltransferase, partial [Candidatus Norongarragalinales archaeon]|nr:glycosyltransferase [Candidatus Norongarragalinales archaeon]
PPACLKTVMHVSVVVATLNEEENLTLCLESLRHQWHPAHEIIVADGHSIDRTVSIAESLADKVVFAPKRTISAGRQTGAIAAEGELLVFCDADAYYPPHWLASLVSAFFRPEVVCAQGKLLVKDPTSLEHAFASHVAPWYFKAALKIGVPTGACSNLAVRKKAFIRAGGFNTDLVTAEDVDLQKRLLAFGENVFVEGAEAYVSARRIRKWGYGKYVGFHVKNWMRYAMGFPPKQKYEPIR